jgi:hypothetical protein
MRRAFSITWQSDKINRIQSRMSLNLVRRYSLVSYYICLPSSVLLLRPYATDYCVKSTAIGIVFLFFLLLNADCKHYIRYEGTECILPIKHMYAFPLIKEETISA